MRRAAVDPQKGSPREASRKPAEGRLVGGRRRPHRGRKTLVALVAGVLLALAVPPLSWWPTSALGFAVLYDRLRGSRLRSRAWFGLAAGIGLFAPTLFWATDFSVAGWAAMAVVEAGFLALASAAVPPGRGRWIAFPSALVLAELARTRWPFGGVPLGGVWLGQAGAPTRFAARIGGPLLLYALPALAGVALAELWRVLRSRREVAIGATTKDATRGSTRRTLAVAMACAGLVFAVCVWGAYAPGGGPPAGELRVAAVQGGGVRGLLQSQVDPATVFGAQVAASQEVRTPVGLVLWPEDVISIDHPLAGSPESAQMSRLARSLHATVVAGVVIDISSSRFVNEAVAWGPDGAVHAALEKVHRVPFGEYVPFRAFFRHLADLSAVPRDAVPGTSPALLHTPEGPMTTLISYEVFFPSRARSGQLAGGQLVLVPTNTSSYSSGQVPAQELSAARLQAVGTGRDLLQAAPTGFSAVVDSSGTVRAASNLGERRVLEATVAKRTGRTLYVDTGDSVMAWLALAGSLGGWVIFAAARKTNRPGGGAGAGLPWAAPAGAGPPWASSGAARQQAAGDRPPTGLRTTCR